MQDKQQTNVIRRNTLKTLLGGSVLGVLAESSHQWITPVVNVVTLPAHAQTTPTLPDVCDVVMGVSARNVPSTCSGANMPPSLLTISVSDGVDDVVIDSISASLPGNASMTADISVGDTVVRGSSFNIVIDQYPTDNAAVCLPSQAGSISVTYSCVTNRSAGASFEVDVLSELLS